jgi:hypothetical protein
VNEDIEICGFCEIVYSNPCSLGSTSVADEAVPAWYILETWRVVRTIGQYRCDASLGREVGEALVGSGTEVGSEAVVLVVE